MIYLMISAVETFSQQKKWLLLEPSKKLFTSPLDNRIRPPLVKTYSLEKSITQDVAMVA